MIVSANGREEELQVTPLSADEARNPQVICSYQHAFSTPGRYLFSLTAGAVVATVFEVEVTAAAATLRDTTVHGLPEQQIAKGVELSFFVCPRDGTTKSCCISARFSHPHAGYGKPAPVSDLRITVTGHQGHGLSLRQERRGLCWLAKVFPHESGIFRVHVAFGSGQGRTSDDWCFVVA